MKYKYRELVKVPQVISVKSNEIEPSSKISIAVLVELNSAVLHSYEALDVNLAKRLKILVYGLDFAQVF